MANGDGVWTPVGSLDVRQQWADFTEFSIAADAVKKAINQRGLDFLLSDDPRAGEIWSEVWQGQIDGQDVDTEKLLRELFTRDGQNSGSDR
jgi:hypothetical protein